MKKGITLEQVKSIRWPKCATHLRVIDSDSQTVATIPKARAEEDLPGFHVHGFAFGRIAHGRNSVHGFNRKSSRQQFIPLVRQPASLLPGSSFVVDEISDRPSKVVRRAAGKASRPAQAPRKLPATSKAPRGTKPASQGKLGSVFGYSVSAVLRALGKAGWTYEAAEAFCRAYKIEIKSSRAMRLQVYRGRTGRKGAPAPLTAEQRDEIARAILKSGNA